MCCLYARVFLTPEEQYVLVFSFRLRGWCSDSHKHHQAWGLLFFNCVLLLSQLSLCAAALFLHWAAYGCGRWTVSALPAVCCRHECMKRQTPSPYSLCSHAMRAPRSGRVFVAADV